MTPEELLLRTFLDEAAELVATVEASLLHMEERGGDATMLNQLMGALHTLKGASATVGLGELCELVHEMEDAVDDVRRERVAASSPLFNQLFAALDTVRGHLAAVAQGERGEDQVAEQRARLRTWRTAHGPTETPAPPEQEVAGLRLGEYDWIRVDVLRKEGRPLHRIEVAHDLAAGPDVWRAALHCLHGMGDVVAHAATEVHGRAQLVALVATSSDRTTVEGALAGGGFTLVAWTDFAEQPAPKPAAPKPRAAGPAHQVIKVDVQRVDRLMEMVGELVIVESMVKNDCDIARLKSPRVRSSMRLLTRISLELQDTAMCLRMVPIRGELRKMERVVRDLARATGKKIRLELQGESTEMDRAIAERMGEPLLHLVRNAVDHGIETAEERAASGKPETSVITIRASHQGGSIVVEVSDDGRGLDCEAILAKARDQGLIEPDSRASDSEAQGLIFAAGFSTATRVTEISGRGVGLDVVRRAIEAIRGRISVASVPGQGTTFRMTLPLTLAIINGTLVRCGDERYVVPTLSVIECLRPSKGALVRYANHRQVLRLRDRIIPVLALRELLGAPGKDGEGDHEHPLVLVVESAGQLLGLAVEDVLFQQQIVIKSLDTPVADRRLFSGAAILSDGRVGLILDIDNLRGHARFRGGAGGRRGAPDAVVPSEAVS